MKLKIERGIEGLVEKLKEAVPSDEENFKINPSYIPPRTDLSGWERTLTDPRAHSDANFRYLVHAIASKNNISYPLQNIFVDQMLIRNQTIQQNIIDLWARPERIAEKEVISTSLIDTTHRETWQAGGYILKVPSGNILKTCRSDCGTFFPGGAETKANLYQERDAKGLDDPDTFLQFTSPYRYNEVVLAGTGRNGGKVEIAGVFVKVFPDGELVDEALAGRMRDIADSRNMPLVRIQEPFIPYREGEPRVLSDAFNYVMNGRLYLFKSAEQSSFTVYEYAGKKSQPMTPQERTEMISAVRRYLSSTPNAELEALVRSAEKVPDDALQQRVEEHYRWKNKERLSYFDYIKKDPLALEKSDGGSSAPRFLEVLKRKLRVIYFGQSRGERK